MTSISMKWAVIVLAAMPGVLAASELDRVGIAIERVMPSKCAGARVTVEDVTIDDEASVTQLLSRRGIRPDVEGISAVYELNPDVSDLRQLQRGRKLRLPTLTGPGETQCLVALTVYPEEKKQFVESVETLKRIAQQRGGLDVSKNCDDVMPNSLADVLCPLDFIATRVQLRDGRPIPASVLRHLTGEANAIHKWLVQGAANPDEFLQPIASDLDVRERAFVQAAGPAASSRYPAEVVEVHTLKDGRDERNLRVMYAPEALVDDPAFHDDFDALSTPTRQRIDEADYFIWAIDDVTRAVKSNRVRVLVRQQGAPLVVQLSTF